MGDSFIREVDASGEVAWNQQMRGQGEAYRAEYVPSLYDLCGGARTGW